MAGRSPVKASNEQRAALEVLAVSRNRGEADRARAILLTLDGWTSARIAEVFRVREDTVRFWRGDFARGGVEAIKASVYAGPPPVKAEASESVGHPKRRPVVLFRMKAFTTQTQELLRLIGEVLNCTAITMPVAKGAAAVV